MMSVAKRHARGFIAIAAVAALASVAYGSPISLTDGVPVTGLAGAAGSEVFYSIEVPAGQTELRVSISGGTGDCDLYVRYGDLPSGTHYDYRPFHTGNNETVTVTDPAAGTWYILLRGNDAYDGVTLVATCTPAVPTALSNGVPVTGISGDEDSWKLYYIDVPAGQASLMVNTWEGSGDVELFVKQGTPPSFSDYDGSSYGYGTEAEVSISSPAAGRWYIMLRAAEDFQGVTLRAVYGSCGSASTLQDDVPITGLSGALGSQACYVIYVPSGQSGISFQISGGTGDCDMYIKKGVRPTTSDYDFRPGDGGNNTESIFVGTGDSGGAWYVLLVADQAYSGVTLQAHFVRQDEPEPTGEVKPLLPGVPVTDLFGDAGSEQFFSIVVPDDVTSLDIRMSGGTGDADLYVRKGELPTPSEYDYHPNVAGSDEQVTITKSVAGTWYIMVRGYHAFSGVSLVATFDHGVPDGVTALENGIPVVDLGGPASFEYFFKIEVPAGQTKLEIAMSDGTGDADLYVRFGAKPTRQEWDYRPYLIGNDETVTIDDPQAGTYYIMVRGYRLFAGVTLTATYAPASGQIKVLDNCVPVTDLSGDQDSEMIYRINVPFGQNALRIEISGGTGDADLYVKRGAQPTTKSWDYHPGLHGNDEVVLIQNPGAGTWYVMVQGYLSFSDVTLEACYRPAGDSWDDWDGCDHCGTCDGSCDDDSCDCDGWVIIVGDK